VPGGIADGAFDPFFRPAREPGAGLGLAVATRGTGEGTSRSGTFRRGTNFRVILPPPDPPPSDPMVAAADPPKRGRVLIVDDERLVARRCVARRSEYRSTDTEARPGSRGHAGPGYDVIFCDLMMPG